MAFGRDPKRFVLRHRARLGSVFTGHILGAPTVIMVGSEALRFTLTTHRHHFVSGRGWPEGLRRLMDGALMMQDGDVHQRTRRLLAPAFAGPALAGYAKAICATAQRHIERWAQAGEIRLYDELKRLSFDVASQLFFGAPEGMDGGRLGRLFATFTAGMAGLHPILPIRLSCTPYGRAFRAREELLREISELIRARARQGMDGSDALARMLRAREELGEASGVHELAEQALFLLFAGHESTTSLITSACLELARHPEWLARAREEQQRLGDGPLTAELAEQMPILDQVLLETERLHAPFAGSFRYVVKDCEHNGVRIPAGHRVFYSINGTHGDPDTFPEPERFRPERFTPEVVKGARRDLHLVGFGAGPRTCLGIGFARLEARIVLALLLRGYEWSLAQRQRLDFVYLPSLFPKDRLRMSLQRRAAKSEGSR